jgi:hypothetical protein
MVDKQKEVFLSFNPDGLPTGQKTSFDVIPAHLGFGPGQVPGAGETT